MFGDPRYLRLILMLRLGDEEEGNDSHDCVNGSGEEKHPGDSVQQVWVSEVPITQPQGLVTARVRHSLDIVRVDEGCLERDPDQGTKSVSAEDEAAHEASPGGGEPFLGCSYGCGVDKGEGQAVA